MRPRELKVCLRDALEAGELIERFLDGMEFDEYRTDPRTTSAVERQFQILGEALARGLRADPAIADRVAGVVAAVGFRNVLVHGYEIVSDEAVWSTAHEDLPALLGRLHVELGDTP